MSGMTNCFPWPWTWEQCKTLWRGGSHDRQPHENGAVNQNVPPDADGERQPLLAEQQAQAAEVETRESGLAGASTGEPQVPPACLSIAQESIPRDAPQDVRREPRDAASNAQREVQHEPSFSFQPPSRGNTLQNITTPDFETATPSRAEDSGMIVSTGFSKKLDIPKVMSGIATHTEDTNVSPSSIHSSGSIRMPKMSSMAEDGELLGVGQKFIGDQPRHHEDDSSDQMDDDLGTTQKLEDQLLEQLIEWPKGENRYFIPIDQQKRLVTAQSIKEELRRVEERDSRLPDEQLMGWAENIWASAPKLFSILVCLDKSKCIFNFLKEGLEDVDLPFIRDSPIGAGRFKLSSRRTPKKPIKTMAKWSRNDIAGFGRDQWWMLSPVFKEKSNNKPRKVRHYELDDMCVMPFIEDHERSKVEFGGFGTVWAVRIHPAHQLWNTANPKNPNPLIALKKLNSTEEKDFKLEVEMLKAFSNHKDRHLIKLLATFRLKNRYHLMFPHCKYNLRTYWEAYPEPKFNSTNVRWFLSQCKGIAHGLMTIHEYTSSEAETAANMAELGRSRLGNHLAVNPVPVEKGERLFGRHGDIKPENILWSDEAESDDECAVPQELEQIGILVIADFGLMDFHGKQSRSIVPADMPASLTYAPPELRLKINISRAYDIWSLGCVYLEFVTWLVDWLPGLQRFPDARGLTGSSDINDDLFYTIIEEKDSPPRAIVRESVTEWMKDLHEKARCSQFIHDFVDLISDEMLVVDQFQRIHCGPLNKRLKDMCTRSQSNPGYLTDPKPYPPRKQTESPPTSPTATEGTLLPTKNEIPVDLDTTTKSPKMRPARISSRSVGVPLRSPSPAGLRSMSPRPSIIFTDADLDESGPSNLLGSGT